MALRAMGYAPFALGDCRPHRALRLVRFDDDYAGPLVARLVPAAVEAVSGRGADCTAASVTPSLSPDLA